MLPVSVTFSDDAVFKLAMGKSKSEGGGVGYTVNRSRESRGLFEDWRRSTAGLSRCIGPISGLEAISGGRVSTVGSDC